MPIFISYSHKDKDFVDGLARQLVQNNVHVWLDRWELQIGDSLISKVQDAITGASALLVILSKSSVASAWCQKELNSGLLRELEERRVVVMPVLIEDCQIPMFLREKLYADFRTDFDDGLKTVLEGVARIANPDTSRIVEPDYHSDWALDWGITDGNRYVFKLALVEQAQGQPFTVLSDVEIVADAAASRAYAEMERNQGGEEARRTLITLAVAEVNRGRDLVILLEDQFERVQLYNFSGEHGSYHIRLSARRLGEDTGRDVVFRIGNQLREIAQHMNDVGARHA